MPSPPEQGAAAEGPAPAALSSCGVRTFFQSGRLERQKRHSRSSSVPARCSCHRAGDSTDAHAQVNPASQARGQCLHSVCCGHALVTHPRRAGEPAGMGTCTSASTPGRCADRHSRPPQQLQRPWVNQVARGRRGWEGRRFVDRPHSGQRARERRSVTDVLGAGEMQRNNGA